MIGLDRPLLLTVDPAGDLVVGDYATHGRRAMRANSRDRALRTVNRSQGAADDGGANAGDVAVQVFDGVVGLTVDDGLGFFAGPMPGKASSSPAWRG